jgi:hypothetical protein
MLCEKDGRLTVETSSYERTLLVELTIIPFPLNRLAKFQIHRGARLCTLELEAHGVRGGEKLKITIALGTVSAGSGSRNIIGGYKFSYFLR